MRVLRGVPASGQAGCFLEELGGAFDLALGTTLMLRAASEAC